MGIFQFLKQYHSLSYIKPLASPIDRVFFFAVSPKQRLSTSSEDPELKEFMDYLDLLKNYEKLGVPKGAGTDSDDGFDLGRMKRLMERLGNPLSKFKAIHIAGTKGKGSTAAFLANILRAEGYNVGSYTSPHIQTIRERISIGRSGELVSAKTLNCIFNKNKMILDQSMELENGRLSHFEVLTAMAFALFAQENVDIAVVEAGLGGARDATNVICSSGLALSIITSISEEHLAALGGSLESIAAAKAGIIKHQCPVVLGGPFLPHIERILRNKASSMCSPVVSASDAGRKCTIKSISMSDGRLCQTCHIVIQTKNSFPVFFELSDVKLLMIGSHQLQNAATATCAALCLRKLGWKLLDGSIQTGLEETFLIGRSQILSSKEVAALGLSGVGILLDGAHTKESANALMKTINMAFPDEHLVLVVAMASDKDHLGFAKECLSGGRIEAAILTEVDIAGGKSRTTSASLLKEHWIQASKHLGFTTLLYDGITTKKSSSNFSKTKSKQEIILATETSPLASLKMAREILRELGGDRRGIFVVTGSLHVVSSVLASLPSC